MHGVELVTDAATVRRIARAEQLVLAPLQEGEIPAMTAAVCRALRPLLPALREEPLPPIVLVASARQGQELRDGLACGRGIVVANSSSDAGDVALHELAHYFYRRYWSDFAAEEWIVAAGGYAVYYEPESNDKPGVHDDETLVPDSAAVQDSFISEYSRTNVKEDFAEVSAGLLNRTATLECAAAYSSRLRAKRDLARTFWQRRGVVGLGPSEPVAVDPPTGCELMPIASNGPSSGAFVRRADGAFSVHIPPATFPMGTDPAVVAALLRPRLGDRAEAFARDYLTRRRQWPVLSVELPGFFIDVNEVTVGQYGEYLRSRGGALDVRFGQGVERDEAVRGVTWLEAAGYCSWVGGRLPTEAEWELAAQPPGGRSQHAKAPPGDQGAPWLGSVSAKQAGAVPSAWGALHMLDSVAEWTSGTRALRPFAAARDDMERPGDRGLERVIRGGISPSEDELERFGFRRTAADPCDEPPSVGLRCVCECTLSWSPTE